MELGEILGKIIYGAANVLAELGNTAANRIDRMSDEKIEKEFPDHSVEEMRNQAEKFHSAYECWQDRKEMSTLNEENNCNHNME